MKNFIIFIFIIAALIYAYKLISEPRMTPGQTMEQALQLSIGLKSPVPKETKKQIEKYCFDNQAIVKLLLTANLIDIQSYKIISQEVNGNEAKVSIEFIPIGKTSLFEPTKELAMRKRTINYYLKKGFGKWVIFDLAGSQQKRKPINW